MQSLVRLARPMLAKSGRLRQPRTFTTLTPLRPTLNPSFRPRLTTSFAPPQSSSSSADVVPPSAISTHPALGGGVAQLRCGPRNTMNGHTRLVQKRRSGFLARKRSKSGRRMLLRRLMKGRKRLGW